MGEGVDDNGCGVVKGGRVVVGVSVVVGVVEGKLVSPTYVGKSITGVGVVVGPAEVDGDTVVVDVVISGDAVVPPVGSFSTGGSAVVAGSPVVDGPAVVVGPAVDVGPPVVVGPPVDVGPAVVPALATGYCLLCPTISPVEPVFFAQNAAPCPSL